MQPEVVWADAKPDPQGYEEVRREVARDAAALAARIGGLLPPRSRPRLRQGRLDRRRLAAFRTDGRVFRGPDRCSERIVLALIVDLSASMRGESGQVARRISILLSETCAALQNACLYAYGHNADHDGTRHTRITRYATPARGRADALGSLAFAGNNRDAHAIEVIGRDLLLREGPKRTPRLAVLVSDALPNAFQFEGDRAVDATRHAIEWLEQVWGPTMLVATEYSPVARSLVSGPMIPLDLDRPVKGLVRFMEWGLRRL